MSVLVAEALKVLRNKIEGFEEALDLRGYDSVEELIERLEDEDSSIVSFILNFNSDLSNLSIKISPKIKEENWLSTRYDYSKIMISSNYIRNTSYEKPSASFIKRVNGVIKKYKENLEDEANRRAEMDLQRNELQAKIDKINAEYDGCIKVFKDSDYKESFSYLEIGGKKYNIDLERDVVWIDNFDDSNRLYWKTEGAEYPMHLAIPFLQEVALNRLLED